MCLNALFQVGEGNVEEVRAVVAAGKPLAYTTVLTLLDRLARRGVVSRRKQGRGYRYFPTVDRNRLRHMALKQFLEYHFSGSADELKSFLENPPAVPETEAEPELVAAAEPLPAPPLAMAQYAGDAGRQPDFVSTLVPELAAGMSGNPSSESEM